MPDSVAINYTVPEGIARERADKVLAGALPDLSRAGVQRLFEEGLVLSGSSVLTKNHKVSAGDLLTYHIPEVRPAHVVAREIALDVLFEDEDIIAINKAPGMVVHPGAGTGEDTLVHALLAHCRGQLSGIGGVERPGIVHRLDRETSGVIVSAKNDRAHRALAQAFASRQLEKDYLALVSGVPALMAGSILKPIARHAVHRHRMTVTGRSGEGREAHTDWTREAVFGRVAALLRCRIHTGRTHQIRVHLKSLGHTVLGDTTYGWRPDPRLPTQPTRVMLHAARLAFTHPTTGRPIDIEAPLPEDFQVLLRRLREVV